MRLNAAPPKRRFRFHQHQHLNMHHVRCFPDFPNNVLHLHRLDAAAILYTGNVVRISPSPSYGLKGKPNEANLMLRFSSKFWLGARNLHGPTLVPSRVYKAPPQFIIINDSITPQRDKLMFDAQNYCGKRYMQWTECNVKGRHARLAKLLQLQCIFNRGSGIGNCPHTIFKEASTNANTNSSIELKRRRVTFCNLWNQYLLDNQFVQITKDATARSRWIIHRKLSSLVLEFTVVQT